MADDYQFREWELNEADAAARAQFEMYRAGKQSSTVQTGIAVVGGAYTGFTAGGPPGAVIGAALSALASYWKSKAKRQVVYAQMDAVGLLRKPRVRYRSAEYSYNTRFVFVRYPYAEQTATIIVPILQKYYPTMSDSQLHKAGTTAQLALIELRKQHKDIPLSLAAEAVLAFNGIARNAAGEYDLITQPTPGVHYTPPPVIHYGNEPPHTPPPTSTPYMLYVLIGLGVAVVIGSK